MGKTIDIVDLQVTFRSESQGEEVVALDGVNLRIPADQFVCIVGRSGCGKTTFLNCIDGSIRPSRGAVRIDGEEVRGPGRDRAMVFQQASLFPWHSTVRNVAYGLELQKVAREEAEAKARQLLDLVGLKGYERYYPAQLSGGMQQRANLARALAVDPEVLLLDEPFAALDAQMREFMQGELTRIWQQFHKTAIFITHDIGEAIFLADRVVVFSAPGAVKADIAIDLPRPRTLDLKRTPAFLRYEDQIWSLLAETERAPSRAVAAAPNAAPARTRAAGPAALPRPSAAPLRGPDLRRTGLGLLSVLAVIAAWEASARLGLLNPVFSSSPSDIALAGAKLLRDPGFWQDFYTTMIEFVIGFAISIVAGIVIGILVGWYKDLDALTAPFVSGLYATPRISLAPLIIIWFGIGIGSKVALVIVSAIFPVLINTATGIRTTDRHFVRIARSFGADDWTLFRTVAIPGAVPYIVTGLRLGSGLAIIGVVVAELVAGTAGIGHRMLMAGETFQTSEMFVCLLAFTGAGILLSQAFGRLEARFDAWRSTG